MASVDTAADPRTRIVIAAAELLAEGGVDALTTRAIAGAAGVQAPAIYRLFGDKAGLLDAVAEHVFGTYVREKATLEPHPDPVVELREGWDRHVAFGLANPAVVALMYGGAGGSAGGPSPAVAAGEDVLRRHVHRIAAAGRLRVSEERAVALLAAAGRGVLLSLLAVPEAHRDLRVSDDARDAVLAAIASDAPVTSAPGPAAAAVALRASLPDASALTTAERRLLAEWLDRLADA